MTLLTALLFSGLASASVRMTDWDGTKMLALTKGEFLEVCGDGATSKEAALDLDRSFMKGNRVAVERDGLMLTVYHPYRATLKKVTELANGRVSVCLTIVAEN